MEITEETICELEDRSIKMIQSGQQKIEKATDRVSVTCGAIKKS